MSFTLHITWWMLPTLVTLGAFFWVLFWPMKGSGSMFGDSIGRLIRAVPGLFICFIAWLVAAIFK